MKNIWSAGFGLSKFKSAGFGYRKMHLGMQALALFFGSLQALDFKNQGKNVVCRLQPFATAILYAKDLRPIILRFHVAP